MKSGELGFVLIKGLVFFFILNTFIYNWTDNTNKEWKRSLQFVLQRCLTSLTSAAAVTKFHPPTSKRSPPQLLTLNLAQQGILISDPVAVKISSYGLFAFCRAAGAESQSVIRGDGLSEVKWRPGWRRAEEEEQAKWVFIWGTWFWVSWDRNVSW